MAAPGAESTATYRSKALYLCVRSLRGREGANRYIKTIGVGRIFEDETKSISRELWLRALLEFDAIVGDEGFRRLTRYFVHPKNLGVWSVLLRGATQPGDIYAKLDESGGDQDYGWTWRSRQQSNYEWTGEVCFLESDSSDDRRRIRKALSAELRSVPLLFGLAPARVTYHTEEKTDEVPHGEEVVQRAVWQSATKKTMQAGTVATVFAGATAAAIVSILGWDGWTRLIVGATSCAVCMIITYILSRDANYRAGYRAQHLRILALEREAVLQKLRVKEISRPHEEPVIAGKYRLSHQIGVGASGAVWKAKRLTDGAYVAIKLLRTALAQDPRATDRLRREAQALGLSWHPHVVEVLDDGLLSSGVAFLVTELLHGQTLAQRIAKQGALSETECATWGVQIADALMAIHGAGVVHRDVKPGNLFIDRPAPDVESLKLIDFGVAAVSWAETRLTRDGARIGTPGYAAPEQENGEEVDPRADLYALGQTLQEALSGLPPTLADEQAPSLRRTSSEWRKVLSRLTARNPKARYNNAREAREALSALSCFQPVTLPITEPASQRPESR